MTMFASLAPAEQARHLANPEGQIGIQVAEWMNGNNRESNAQILALLNVQAGNRVLEIGFGNGRATPQIVGQAEDVQYTGIDISDTMTEEALRFNAELAASGRANFHRAFAERMPFADESFDRVLSIAVMHFWQDPLPSLKEIYRVMRPGAVAVMSALDPRTRPSFAQQEFSFYLRSASEWVALGHQLSFRTVDTQCVETEQRTPDGKPTKRYSLRLIVER
jgi:ubiquinone/menaquinone biosynthesis C-methylase UbiE